MKFCKTFGTLLGLAVVFAAAAAADDAVRQLNVHVVQANNNSPYTFVRAKFEPGEVADPWAVRFFDEQGAEIPYFVWDSVTWQVAREGRADWGNRYALINHAPGNAPDVLAARPRKLRWAQQHLPALGAKLAAEDEASRQHGNSICAALYLLRHRCGPYGKQRLTLRIFSSRQVDPVQRLWKGKKVEQRFMVNHGELVFHDLPDRLKVAWKGRELFSYAGFEAGETKGGSAHADPQHPFAVEVRQGIVTRLDVTGRTAGRQGGTMDWQCTYWLLPEGCYVALEGYSLSDTAGYLGGPQKLSIWRAAEEITQVREPLWESPWWVHQLGQRGYAATHLFYATPLTVGFGNNPFTVNSYAPPSRVPTVELDGDRLALRWHHAIDDLAVSRLMAPELFVRLGRISAGTEQSGREWIDNNKKVVLAGKVTDPPKWMTPECQRFVEEQLRYVKWEPMIDWLYRQYAVGVGGAADEAENALRSLLGAAAGWIDRPMDEEQAAALLVSNAQSLGPDAGLKWTREMEVLPGLLHPDPAALKQALARWPNQVAQTEHYIELMRTHVALGGNPIQDRTAKDGRRGEGWIVNPSYHATWLPYNVRFLDHFGLPHPEDEYRQAILRYADFSLELLGGKPLDTDRLRRAYLSHWPSRFVAIIPLAAAADCIKPTPEYARAATVMFDILMTMVDRNPHGYWSAWAAHPQKAELFDTVYNAAGCQRGIPAFWADGRLDLIGRQRASQFVAAQARWIVFSGQWLDTFETDNVTAIYATKHGGHPGQRKQMPLFLYDDFEFYRGLVGPMICWAAANPSRPGGHGDLAAGSPERELGLAEGGCYLLRWALGIGAWPKPGVKSSGSKWFEYRTGRIPGKQGFRIQLWNRLPWPKSTLSLTTQDLGLPAPPGDKGPVHRTALWLQMAEPAYRVPAEIEVQPEAGTLLVRLTRPMRLRLYYGAVMPELAAAGPLALLARSADGTIRPVPEADITSTFVDWQAEAGQYQIRSSKEFLPSER